MTEEDKSNTKNGMITDAEKSIDTIVEEVEAILQRRVTQRNKVVAPAGTVVAVDAETGVKYDPSKIEYQPQDTKYSAGNDEEQKYQP